MIDELLVELAKQVPSAMAVIGTVYLFLRAEREREERRVVNAKQMTDAQRAHELQMEGSRRGKELETINLWASTVKNIIAAQDASNQNIVMAIKDMHLEMSSQYEKMGITKDLYDTAKKILTRSEQ